MAEPQPCRYCGQTESHSDTCPTTDPNRDRAVSEWERGHARGYADECIAYFLLRSYDKYFRLGYRIGKDKVDAGVDAAAQARCDW